MDIRTLENTSLEQLTATFNEAFKGYEIPMHPSVEDIAKKIAVENIDLRLSVGAFDGEELVGFMLHAVGVYDGKMTSWNGGTGVVEAAREKKLTEKMLEFILPEFRQRQVEQLLLEVLKSNERAKNVYSKLGFTVKRPLLSYKGEMCQSPASHKVEPLETYDLEGLAAFEDTVPCWQLADPVIRNWDDAIVALGVSAENRLVGYLLYNKVNRRICRFAVDKPFRRQGIATAMFHHISQHYDKQLTVVNMDGGTGNIPKFLSGIGLELFIGQWEMERIL